MKKLFNFLNDQGLVSDDYYQYAKDALKDSLKGVDFQPLLDDEDGSVDAFNEKRPQLPIFDEQTEKRLTDYCNALANLYGLISCDQAYRIINRFNHHLVEGLEQKKVEDWFDAHRDEQDCNFVVYDIDVAMIVNKDIKDQQEAEQLLSEQLGKTFYLPTKRELLKYRNADYYEANSFTRAYSEALKKDCKMPAGDLPDNTSKAVQAFRADSSPKPAHLIHNLQDDIYKQGFKMATKEDLVDWMRVLMDMSNHVRVWANRGWTPTEVSNNPVNVLDMVAYSGQLTPEIIKMIQDAKVDPGDFLLALPNSLTKAQEDHVVDQVFGLKIPGLAI